MCDNMLEKANSQLDVEEDEFYEKHRNKGM
jgi:hypothetical protein